MLIFLICNFKYGCPQDSSRNCSNLEAGSESFFRILVIINQLTQLYIRKDLNTGTSAKEQWRRYGQVGIHQGVKQVSNMLELNTVTKCNMSLWFKTSGSNAA